MTDMTTETMMEPSSRNEAAKGNGHMKTVWDPMVRILHWGLAGAFALAYATGEEIWTVHEVAGFAVAAIVGLRLIWGALGTRHARFSDFLTSPLKLVDYLKGLIGMHPARHVGHNPAGGLFAVVLMTLAFATAASGWAQAYLPAGGLAGVTHELHEVLANLTLAAVIVHIIAAIAMSMMHGENLIGAMITGRKRNQD